MPSQNDPLILEPDQHILTVTLNRPEQHNAISQQDMVLALESACHKVNADPNIRVMILTGAGKSFCAGGNIKDMQQKSDMFAGDEAAVAEAYRRGIQRIPLALWNVQVPVIAAVNGAAVGAGCDLAMMCDIRIGCENARFAESFVKLGIIPGDGGAWFLPRVIGMARASDMALTGRFIDAETALAWNMISECLPPEQLMKRAQEIARDIAANPPLAVRETKKLLRKSSNIELPEMLEQCASIQARLHQTQDHMEAVNAFLEKRAGQFNGQ